MKKSVKNALLAYAFDCLASELESYRVPITHKGRTWYDVRRGDCEGPFAAVMSLAEALGDEWPYVIIWTHKRRYFRVVPR